MAEAKEEKDPNLVKITWTRKNAEGESSELVTNSFPATIAVCERLGYKRKGSK